MTIYYHVQIQFNFSENFFYNQRLIVAQHQRIFMDCCGDNYAHAFRRNAMQQHQKLIVRSQENWTDNNEGSAFGCKF